ncbi:MAG: cysteine--tRNA ligase [Phycisphaerae bacterium]
MLRLYNTLTRSVEPFEPIDPGAVRLYTCGPTVYNYAHIGNLRTYVFEDILKRALWFCGYEVRHVMNVTDVGHLVSDADEGEDKMALGARREGKTVWEIARFYWDAFRRDMEQLDLIEPDVWCRATEHIEEQIELVRKLEENGYTYAIDDGVYFDTSKLPDYGKLAHMDMSQLQAGARVAMVQGKRNPTDFALWKFSPADKQRLMEWDSPWGVGFPGWHIECAAMAIKYLGERLDIHCGGVDHINVHHTNEIAQAECALGHKWCNWWMHAEFLVMATEDASGKMSKSSGEFLTLEKLVESGYDPLAYRMLCLTAHYRQQLTFTFEALDGAQSALRRLRRTALELRKNYSDGDRPIDDYVSEFREAIEDDLNTPRAMSAMWRALRDESAEPGRRYATLLEMDKVLGFGVERMEKESSEKAVEEVREEVASSSRWTYLLRTTARQYDLPQLRLDGNFLSDMEEWIRIRRQARRQKDFEKADAIRLALQKIGIALEDEKEGTIWRATGSKPSHR